MEPLSYKYIIFDIDGTLIDTETAVINSLTDTLKEITGISYLKNDLLFALGIPGENTLAHFGISDTHHANLLWNKYFRNYSHTIKLFEGIESELKKLIQEGYRLGIITSKNKNELKADFEPFGITSYFDIIICVDDCREPKPSGDPLLKFMELTQTKAKDLLYIGDTIYDCKCAKNANVKFGLAKWGSHSIENISADFYIDHPSQINEIIN